MRAMSALQTNLVRDHIQREGGGGEAPWKNPPWPDMANLSPAAAWVALARARTLLNAVLTSCAHEERAHLERTAAEAAMFFGVWSEVPRFMFDAHSHVRVAYLMRWPTCVPEGVWMMMVTDHCVETAIICEAPPYEHACDATRVNAREKLQSAMPVLMFLEREHCSLLVARLSGVPTDTLVDRARDKFYPSLFARTYAALFPRAAPVLLSPA